MARTLKFEAQYRFPPEAVWRVLTDSALIERWLMRNDFQPELGAEFTFRDKPVGGWDGIVYCKVTVFEPPRVLAYTWRSNLIDTLVRFELEGDAKGTRLKLEHSGFEGGFGDMMARFFMGLGWRRKVAKVIPALVAEIAGANPERNLADR
jgi:uncharacterized protein YndB with AHSA1/START domain